jgi:hypothetical protein
LKRRCSNPALSFHRLPLHYNLLVVYYIRKMNFLQYKLAKNF